MATIVTRSGKGSALTWAELDANFNNLNAGFLPLGGGTLSGLLATAPNTAAFASANDTTLSVRSNGSAAATMSFHRPGYYAVNFGLDTDNVFKVGGWSMGGPYKIHHDGNLSMSLSGTTLTITKS